MGDHERGKLDDSGFHYDGCAGGPCGWGGGSGGSLDCHAMEEAEVHREEVAVEMVCG